MSIFDKQELDEQARINELERQKALAKKKLDKKVTKQKIMLGAFFSDLLEKNGNIEGINIDALREYTVNNLLTFGRKGDEKVMQPIVDALSKSDKKSENEQPLADDNQVLDSNNPIHNGINNNQYTGN